MNFLSSTTLLTVLLAAASSVIAATRPDGTAGEDSPVHQGTTRFHGQVVNETCYTRPWGENTAHIAVLPQKYKHDQTGWSVEKILMIELAGCTEQARLATVLRLHTEVISTPSKKDHFFDAQGNFAIRFTDEYGVRLPPGTILSSSIAQDEIGNRHFRLKAKYRLASNEPKGESLLVPVNVNVTYF